MLVYFVFCLYFISNFVSCAQYDKTPDGYLIGALSNPKPKAKIQGNIYFVDATNIFIKNLQYTYEAPDMYFWLDKTDLSDDGIKIPSPKSGTDPLEPNYINSNVSLTLPKGLSLKDYGVFGLWCKSFSQNFGDVHYEGSKLPF